MTDATEATVSAKGLAVVGAMIGSLAGYAVPTSSLIFSIGIISFVGLLGGTVGHVTEYWLIKNRLLSSGGQSGDGSSSEPEDISGDMIAADQSAYSTKAFFISLLLVLIQLSLHLRTLICTIKRKSPNWKILKEWQLKSLILKMHRYPQPA